MPPPITVAWRLASTLMGSSGSRHSGLWRLPPRSAVPPFRSPPLRDGPSSPVPGYWRAHTDTGWPRPGKSSSERWPHGGWEHMRLPPRDPRFPLFRSSIISSCPGSEHMNIFVRAARTPCNFAASRKPRPHPRGLKYFLRSGRYRRRPSAEGEISFSLLASIHSPPLIASLRAVPVAIPCSMRYFEASMAAAPASTIVSTMSFGARSGPGHKIPSISVSVGRHLWQDGPDETVRSCRDGTAAIGAPARKQAPETAPRDRAPPPCTPPSCSPGIHSAASPFPRSPSLSTATFPFTN